MSTKKIFFGLILLLIIVGVYKVVFAKTNSFQVKSMALSIPPQVFTIQRIGYIRKIFEDNGRKFLELDDVQLLSKDKGTCLMDKEELNEKTGKVEIPQCDYQGYLIINEGTWTDKFEITNNTIITRLVNSLESKQITYEDFKKLGERNFQKTLYTIKETDAVISNITEEYLP